MNNAVNLTSDLGINPASFAEAIPQKPRRQKIVRQIPEGQFTVDVFMSLNKLRYLNSWLCVKQLLKEGKIKVVGKTYNPHSKGRPFFVYERA